jgi:glycerol-3-phosphate dehydrogenase (NAD(P)+)
MATKIAVLGAGSWATAIAVTLARRHRIIHMWGRRDDLVREINEEKKNDRYLPGITLPKQIIASRSLEEVLKGAKTVIFGVPSHSFREVLKISKDLIEPEAIIINSAKGLEENTQLRLSEVFIEETGEENLGRYVVLSGPSHAEEVARSIPTAVVVASFNMETAQRAQDIFMGPHLRVYTNPDVIGVEVGGALKNIIALGTGIADGLDYGDNTTAALVTRGLAEITRLGINLGANPLTFIGLAGVGDLMVTCTSKHSRNRRAGREIGMGASLQEALNKVDMVVEGVRTTKAVLKLARKFNVEMPITEQMYNVLFKGLSPRTAVGNLMSRGRRHEMEEVAETKINWCSPAKG